MKGGKYATIRPVAYLLENRYSQVVVNHFFVEPALVAGPEVRLEGEIAHQLSRVLRLEPGAHILLLDGLGTEYEVELTAVQRQGKTDLALGRVLERRSAAGEPRVRLTLYQALLKGEKFDFVLQKGTEVGVSRFVPLLTERCVVQTARPDRWKKIIREAAEQSRRGKLPELVERPLHLSEALDRLKAEGQAAFMAWEEEAAQSFHQLPDGLSEMAILIGPEGGFSKKEAAQAQAAGVQTISLGKRILRAETAGPIATALALYQLGDI
jgi:16S rRNA (uracil1498-N3)-methyltransferase